MSKKLSGRPFLEAIDDINRVTNKDADILLVEAIFLSSRFLPEYPRMFPVELLSRFSRAPGANSPAIGRMVAEAALKVLVTSERCIVPFYPCVSPSSAGVRRRTGYGPTNVLAVNTVQMQRRRKRHLRTDEKEEEEEEEKEEQKKEVEKEGEEHEEKDYEYYSATLAVAWGERCGLQVWRSSPENDMTLEPLYEISDEVRPVSTKSPPPCTVVISVSSLSSSTARTTWAQQCL